MRRVIVLLIAFHVSFSPAFACGQLSRSAQQKAEEQFERTLSRTIKVRGTYRVDPDFVRVEGEMESGGIYSHKGKLKYRTSSLGEQVGFCSLHAYPGDNSRGTFYLKRYGKDRFEIVHFDSD